MWLTGSAREEKGLAWRYSVEDGSWAGDRMYEAMCQEGWRWAAVQELSGQEAVLGGRDRGSQ